MSAVPKKVMPASSAAPTTAWVSLRPIRMPKLLQPRPTPLTLSELIMRVSIATPPCAPVRAAVRRRQYCTGGVSVGNRSRGEEAADGRRLGGRDGGCSAGRGGDERGRLRGPAGG